MKKPKREPLALTQARMLIQLAKAEGCTVLKVGEFYVQFGALTEPHDACGFEVSATPDDEYLEAKRNV